MRKCKWEFGNFCMVSIGNYSQLCIVRTSRSLNWTNGIKLFDRILFCFLCVTTFLSNIEHGAVSLWQQNLFHPIVYGLCEYFYSAYYMTLYIVTWLKIKLKWGYKIHCLRCHYSYLTYFTWHDNTWKYVAARSALGRAHVLPPTKVFPRLAVNTRSSAIADKPRDNRRGVSRGIFCTCGSNNWETVEDRWVHAARQFSFHPYNF